NRPFFGRVVVTLLYQKRNGFLLFYPKKCPKSERYANTFGTSSETEFISVFLCGLKINIEI
ncbi:hypothetical protein, partial [Geobacillus sp. MR]|uniref:hypothetical protein n=1 Tax=Geobacillus sp. MR TaxID=2508875 RepID=UPI001C0EF805